MKEKTRNRLISYGLGYDNPERVPVDRTRLGPFVDGYIEAALWSSHDAFDDSIEFLDEKYDTGDIEEATLLQMVRDCVAFYWRCRAILEDCYERGDISQAEAGHCFWLSRNGHGAGFFDKGHQQHWDILQNNARGFGEFDLWVNEDNQVASNLYTTPSPRIEELTWD